MSEIDPIKRRFAELDIAYAQEVARHKEALDAIKAETEELRVAQRVLARLTGRPASEEGGNDYFGKMPNRGMTTPEYIIEILKVHGRSPFGLSPKLITNHINEKWPQANIQPIAVSTTCWRMVQDGRLEKIGALYRLPKKKAADPTSVEDGSAAPDSLDTQAREGGAGGGT